jgi:predicted kinase
MIVMMAGLPGTGKSTLAAAAMGRLASARVVSKDTLRRALFDPSVDAYSAEQNDFLLDLMLAAAGYWLDQGVAAVFLDGRTFSRAYQRDRVQACGRPVLKVECVCPAELALARIAAAEGHPALDRDAALYERVRREFEPIAEPKLVIDTSRPLDACVDELISALR